MKRTLLTATLCCLSLPVLAQTPAAPSAPQDSQAQFASLLASNISQLLANTDVLKRQMELLQEQNGKLKDELAKATHPSGQPPQ
jgi:hypothetical protein